MLGWLIKHLFSSSVGTPFHPMLFISMNFLYFWWSEKGVVGEGEALLLGLALQSSFLHLTGHFFVLSPRPLVNLPVLEFLYRRIWTWSNFQIDAKLKFHPSLDSFVGEVYIAHRRTHLILPDIQGFLKHLLLVFSKFIRSFYMFLSTCSKYWNRQWHALVFVSLTICLRPSRDSSNAALWPLSAIFSAFFQTLSLKSLRTHLKLHLLHEAVSDTSSQDYSCLLLSSLKCRVIFSLVIDYTLPCIIVFSEYVSSVLSISKLFPRARLPFICLSFSS